MAQTIAVRTLALTFYALRFYRRMNTISLAGHAVDRHVALLEDRFAELREFRKPFWWKGVAFELTDIDVVDFVLRQQRAGMLDIGRRVDRRHIGLAWLDHRAHGRVAATPLILVAGPAHHRRQPSGRRDAAEAFAIVVAADGL